jgi:hypothetical protein
MRARIEEGFRVVIIAENESERLCMKEWEERSAIDVDDMCRDTKKYINPFYIGWEYRGDKE